MSTDRVRETVEAVSARLRDLTAAHDEAVANARAVAEIEAEKKWGELLSAARSETQQQVEAAVTAARTEISNDVRHSSLRELGTFLQTLDGTASLGQTLDVIARAAAERTRDSRLYVADGRELREWDIAGGAPAPVPAGDAQTTIVAEVVRTKEATRRDGLVAVPIALDGAPVAVLCAGADHEAAVEVIARAGAGRLAWLTAFRTLQARHWLQTETAVGTDRAVT